MMKKYVFKPYNENFPELFDNEKRRIAALLGSDAVIEHIGSTAVPGLGGKGIIDIAIAVKKENLSKVSQQLQNLGYEFRPTFSTPDRLYFIIYLPDPEEGKRRYHIHLTYPENKEWKRFLGFRNYLRHHPQEVQEYAEMKRTAALEANQEGERYRKLKEPIFEKIDAFINNLQIASVESLNDAILAEARAFLMEQEDFCLFLLGNLEAHGPKLTTAPNSGNFKLIRADGQIIAVFSLTRRGNLVVQSSLSEDWILEKILGACQDEGLPILGLLGEWHFCQRLWSLFKKKEIIHNESFISKEILYTLDLGKQSLSESRHVRLLTPADYQQWKPLRIEYLREEGLPNDLSEQQLQELFLEKVEAKISWGYFLEQRLVAMAELNAKAVDLGQVGGVYTTPIHRKKGFAQSVMHQLMRDAKNIHKIRKLIIFTAENNHPARKLYESLKVHPVGYYALMFGNKSAS